MGHMPESGEDEKAVARVFYVATTSYTEVGDWGGRVGATKAYFMY